MPAVAASRMLLRPFASSAILALALATSSAAQTPATDGPEPGVVQADPHERHFVQLRYPRDKEYVVATVDGQPIWLEHLVEHIDRRHYPGFRRLMSGPDGKGSPDGRRLLESDLIAPWVRYMADITALRMDAEQRSPDLLPRTTEGARGIDQERLDQALSAALKAGFEEFLAVYTADLERRGLPTTFDQQRINNLLTDYQMRSGMACEVQGWLDYLEPPDREFTDEAVHDFYQDHPRFFGGGVTIEHILIQNRDAGTGILLKEAGRIRAATRLAEVQDRMLPDGSNFEELARLFSEDTRTAPDGGRLEYIERFDQRMPTMMCRTAWSLQDGEVSDVIETQYGWHLIKRLEHEQKMFMLFSEDVAPMVRALLVRLRQENLLVGARERRKVVLHL